MERSPGGLFWPKTDSERHLENPKKVVSLTERVYESLWRNENFKTSGSKKTFVVSKIWLLEFVSTIVKSSCRLKAIHISFDYSLYKKERPWLIFETGEIQNTFFFKEKHNKTLFEWSGQIALNWYFWFETCDVWIYVCVIWWFNIKGTALWKNSHEKKIADFKYRCK